jgi:hypothetical protein
VKLLLGRGTNASIRNPLGERLTSKAMKGIGP